MDRARLAALGSRFGRVVVSAFVTWHLAATFVVMIPLSPLKVRYFPTVQQYMLPLGLWQFWGMFAPDPFHESLVLEAEVVDAHGVRHRFEFPKLADFSKWRGIPRYRHCKFACNLLLDEFEAGRRYTARYVARRLNLPADAYPLVVEERLMLTPLPPPGQPPDPFAKVSPYKLGQYRIESPGELEGQP
ncbi:MAG: hypothetical protein KGM43_06060 [Planctomycetota bacterium]|nr:hypothetical protein [Planctomycetota bacterium]